MTPRSPRQWRWDSSRLEIDQTHLHQGAVKATLAFRRRGEIAVAALLQQAGTGGEHAIQRQAGLLRGDGPQKGDVEISALAGADRIDIEKFHRVERAELAAGIR